jgi:hypothetical protein
MTSHPPRSLATLILALGLLVLAGCGGGREGQALACTYPSYPTGNEELDEALESTAVVCTRFAVRVRALAAEQAQRYAESDSEMFAWGGLLCRHALDENLAPGVAEDVLTGPWRQLLGWSDDQVVAFAVAVEEMLCPDPLDLEAVLAWQAEWNAR